ncbi:MAG: cadmium-translocating P-type ATPase, partial [Candidatus Methanomethylophilaceae archaeon]|nr:cadmium-translocating P-type ATPase [Candidatus Methanomethylophilaceae archaeon]
PREMGVGERVLSGTINLTARIVVEVDSEYEDSTVSKILELVEESVSRKASVEKFITKFARYYTPLVVLGAFLTVSIPVLLGQDLNTWLYRGFTFLVVSCPCALVISVPLGYFCGIGAGSKLGILVKGGNYLEALAHAEHVVFDKTGTLTQGRFSVKHLHTVDSTEEEILELAAIAESKSNHPIARSIVEGHGSVFSEDRIAASEEVPGKGVHAVIDGHEVLVGNHRLMADNGIEYDSTEYAGTSVHVSRNGRYMGHIVVADTVKSGSKETVSELKKLGVKETVMLTGDSAAIGNAVAEELGIDRAECELLPADKNRFVDELIKSKGDGKGTVVFVGDGINDAPSLARADIGIAMGALGSDSAIEAADLVIMDDDPRKIPVAIRLARKVNSIVYQNIVFALTVKFVILALSVFGIANMWAAVFGDVGVSIIAILNSMRCLSTRKFELSERWTFRCLVTYRR